MIQQIVAAGNAPEVGAGALGEHGAALQEPVQFVVRGLESRQCGVSPEVGTRREPLQEGHHPQEVLVSEEQVSSGPNSLAAEERARIMQSAESAAVGCQHRSDGVLVGQKPALRAHHREVHHPRLAVRASSLRLQRRWPQRRVG